MPRIIRYKDYSPIGEYNEHNDNNGNSTNDQSYNGEESASGRHFLNNAVIISSMATPQIREALSRYKGLILLLERELFLRSSVPRKNELRSPKRRKSLYENFREAKALTKTAKRILRMASKDSNLSKVVLEYLQSKGISNE